MGDDKQVHAILVEYWKVGLAIGPLDSGAHGTSGEGNAMLC
ncbi:hypothetical protein PAMC26510_37900 [Caballeronia sordidicola]|uniref:Uncharacterized protein n=1 Tax=Caballeronia sordidicola TaxID=196367 RepID=A0A2C9XVU6_CABSO|nr:hypothetical protein PAMC26510_37900 [Caballeronia sordidicola]